MNGAVKEISAESRQRTLRWLFTIQLVSMGAMEMSGPFWPLHLRELGGLSAHALAWASSIAYAGPMVMAMCFTPFWGRVGDRVGHKPMLLRALVALAATQLWIAFADDTLSILLVRLIQGALAGFIAAAQAYGAAVVSKEKRGSLMANLQVATAVGSVAGPLFGGWLFDAYGFRLVNLAATAICAACAFVAYFTLPAMPTRRPERKTASDVPSSFSLAAFAGLLFAIVLVQAGKMMPQAFFGLYTEQVLHAPAWITGLCYGATALGLCIAAPLWGKRFEQQPRPRVLSEVESIAWTCAAVVALQAVSQNTIVFVLTRIVWGVCLGALLPVFYALLSRDADSTEQGRVLGAGNSAAKAGALLGTGIGGAALAYLPIQYAFWPVALVYAVAAVGIRRLRHRRVGAGRGRQCRGDAALDLTN